MGTTISLLQEIFTGVLLLCRHTLNLGKFMVSLHESMSKVPIFQSESRNVAGKLVNKSPLTK